ncbi:MAG: 30S ribosome-binding factor RbfA [Oscillospiraceae bacterium]|nr:30S ribosome-binding factor RbfA [Oscillospiraceae bacterium]
MPSQNLNRISEDIKREICAIMRTVKDPRVSELISVVRVEVTRDLSYATCYVSAFEGMEASKRSVEGLKSAAGYIRRELGGALGTRHVPELRFIPDDSIEYSARISKMLEK